MTDNLKRFNILNIIGVTQRGVCTEEMVAPCEMNQNQHHPHVPAIASPSPEVQKHIAHVIRSIADAIEKHELIATNVKINSVLDWNEWLKHEIVIGLEIPISRPPDVK